MKAGDLVKWTYPGNEDYGLVLSICEWGYEAHIMWGKNPEHSGGYPIKHKWLKLVSESA